MRKRRKKKSGGEGEGVSQLKRSFFFGLLGRLLQSRGKNSIFRACLKKRNSLIIYPQIITRNSSRQFKLCERKFLTNENLNFFENNGIFWKS